MRARNSTTQSVALRGRFIAELFGKALESQATLIARAACILEHAIVTHLAGPRLMPARVIGHMQVSDLTARKSLGPAREELAFVHQSALQIPIDFYLA